MAYGKIEKALQALRRALDVALKSDSTTIQFTDRYDRAKYIAPSGRVCVGSVLEPSEVDSIVAASEPSMPMGKRERITRRRDGDG